MEKLFSSRTFLKMAGRGRNAFPPPSIWIRLWRHSVRFDRPRNQTNDFQQRQQCAEQLTSLKELFHLIVQLILTMTMRQRRKVDENDASFLNYRYFPYG